MNTSASFSQDENRLSTLDDLSLPYCPAYPESLLPEDLGLSPADVRLPAAVLARARAELALNNDA